MMDGGRLENWRNRNMSTNARPFLINLAVLTDVSYPDPYGL